MKKIISQLLILIPLLFMAGIAAAYTSPTGAPTVNNTDAPIDISSTAQVKNGGLSVGVFQAGNAGGSALLDQQSIFHGMIRGGMPSDTSSNITFGSTANPVDAVVNGTVALAGNLQSNSLKTASGQQQVCADSNGKFFLCGTSSSTATTTNADTYLYSSGGANSVSVDNLGNGDCTPGYTTFSLGTGNPISNSIGGFANPHLSISDSWPNPLNPNPANGSGTSYAQDMEIRPDVDISGLPQLLALTAPKAGTYDIKYSTSGNIQMLLDNGKTTQNASTGASVAFYMSIKRTNGTQENDTMAPLYDPCGTGGQFGSFFLYPQQVDVAGDSGIPRMCEVQAITSSGGGGNTYHAETNFSLNFDKTVQLQQGDRVYLYGITQGTAGINGGGRGFLGLPILFGSDKCKPYQLTVSTNSPSIFDVTLHP